MQQIGIMHRMHPAANIVIANWLAQRRAIARLAEVLIDVRTIEGVGHGLVSLFAVGCVAVS
jgi:hypothetical protein